MSRPAFRKWRHAGDSEPTWSCAQQLQQNANHRSEECPLLLVVVLGFDDWASGLRSPDESGAGGHSITRTRPILVEDNILELPNASKGLHTKYPSLGFPSLIGFVGKSSGRLSAAEGGG